MSKRDKLIERLLNSPIDFEYGEARSLLAKFGLQRREQGAYFGVEGCFRPLAGHIIRLHRPHPGNIIEDISNRAVD
ncbi:type II toxin-antitoxin system HicA family toxin [Desulfosporosinus lacus]|uniref:HicA toxin of toxin-antitoxin n=1 Tax=Desulfosporosinus lacus DSM 15449 TaxID=1121420 RepID=A0A1M6HCV7_9FIRM|nr:type II toxin-antitoxin system HicA family toxin [Desulfosporosinus lacus]SHJ20010.1 hypothetical protein SAMN02746098_05330 [Desulfosporosinus lacus DSM 15449]